VVPAPRVCTDPAEAFRCCRRDGACIYQAFRDPASLLSEDELTAALAAVAPTVFGAHLAVAQPPIFKRLGIQPSGKSRTRPGDLGMEPNLPHMDTAYGMLSNDWLILANDAPAAEGGESCLLDGYALIDGLAPPMRRASESVQMDHGGGLVASPRPHPGTTEGPDPGPSCPVLSFTPDGRRVLCTPTGGGIKNEDGTGGITNWVSAPSAAQPLAQIEVRVHGISVVLQNIE
jgi:hypothetical protein